MKANFAKTMATKVVATAMALTIGLSVFVPNRAQAMLFATGAAFPAGVFILGAAAYADYQYEKETKTAINPGWYVFYFLDKELKQLPPITAENLIKNTWSADRAEQVETDYKAFNEKLKMNKAILSLKNGESKEEIRKNLNDIATAMEIKVSDDFLNVYSNQLSFAAQAVSKK